MKPLSPYSPSQPQRSSLPTTTILVCSVEDAPSKYALPHRDRNIHRRIHHQRDICLYLPEKSQFSIPHLAPPTFSKASACPNNHPML